MSYEHILANLPPQDRVEALRVASEFALSHDHPISYDELMRLHDSNRAAFDIFSQSMLDATKGQVNEKSS